MIGEADKSTERISDKEEVRDDAGVDQPIAALDDLFSRDEIVEPSDSTVDGFRDSVESMIALRELLVRIFSTLILNPCCLHPAANLTAVRELPPSPVKLAPISMSSTGISKALEASSRMIFIIIKLLKYQTSDFEYRMMQRKCHERIGQRQLKNSTTKPIKACTACFRKVNFAKEERCMYSSIEKSLTNRLDSKYCPLRILLEVIDPAPLILLG